MTAYDTKLNALCPAENPPLPKGFAGLTVETLVLAPTLFQQLDMHFLAMNNTLNSSTMYIIFLGDRLSTNVICMGACPACCRPFVKLAPNERYVQLLCAALSLACNSHVVYC